MIATSMMITSEIMDAKIPPPYPERLLTVAEVAEILGMSTAWVRQHGSGKRRPRIACVKLGKSLRFRRQAIIELIQSVETKTDYRR